MINFKIFTPIKGYEKLYRISQKGQIYSFITNKLLKLNKDKDGYLLVGLYKNGKRKMEKVHRLVLKTFKGDCPNKCETAHINGNRKDNNLSNLKWMSHKENESHKIIHGTSNIGDRNGLRKYPERAHTRKLKSHQIYEIRSLYENNIITLREISQQFKIGISNVHSIVCKRSWKHLL